MELETLKATDGCNNLVGATTAGLLAASNKSGVKVNPGIRGDNVQIKIIDIDK